MNDINVIEELAKLKVANMSYSELVDFATTSLIIEYNDNPSIVEEDKKELNFKRS